MNRNPVTIAEVLKPAGYATYAIGKWHITKKTKPKIEADRTETNDLAAVIAR